MSRNLGSVAAASVLLVGLIHLGGGIGWNDPLTSTDSLAQEAQRKLAGRFDEPPGQADLAANRNETATRGPYLVIDTHTNTLYLRTADSVIFRARCSTGSRAELTDRETGRTWRFETPLGIFRVTSLAADPWWRKPDWAFIEEGERPPANDTDRLDGDALGDFAIGFGDGYYIHGTLYERLIGVAVTHGCIRLGGDDLKQIYAAVELGTPIVVF